MFAGAGLTSSGFVFEVNSLAVRDCVGDADHKPEIVWMFFHYLVISLARH